MTTAKLANLVCALACLPAIACNHQGPQKYPVSGDVTWNGEPLAEGRLTVFAMDETVLPVSTEIKHGKFATEAQAGKMRVEISASRVVSPAVPGKFGEVREQLIPSRFNAQSELTAEVTPEGKNYFTFELK